METEVNKSEKKVKRAQLKDLFNDPSAIQLDRALMHQSFQIPGAGQESTISCHRPGMKGLEVVYHPVYGLIGFWRGEYFLSPSANVISAHEIPMPKRK